jgi:hypothetical protein
MRCALALLLLASPAAAWQATLGPVCTLEHETPSAHILLTHDPAQPLYTLTITRKSAPWPSAPTFGMTFEGTSPLSIGTDRHSLSPDGHALTVTDRGFGNVLNGLQFNRTARATSGGASEALPLTDAAPAVQAFRDCPPFTGA